MKKLIQSFEEGCAITGDDATKLPDVSWMPELRGKAIVASYKMSVISKAQNIIDKFVPDYSNARQYKWYPWLIWVASRSAFVFQGTIYSFTLTNLGSRFCFIDTNTAEFMGKHYEDLYNDIMADI